MPLYTRTQLLVPDMVGAPYAPIADIWTPDEMGLTYWDLDPANSDSVVRDGSGSISQWTDVKQGLAFTIPSGGTSPAYDPEGWTPDDVDPSPTVDLAGNAGVTTGCMLSAAGPLSTILNMFMVAERGTQSDDTTSTLRRLLCAHVGNPAGGNGYFVHMSLLRPGSDATQSLMSQGGLGTGSSNASVGGFTAGSKAVLGATFDNTAVTGIGRVNGGQPSSASAIHGATQTARWQIGGAEGSKQAAAIKVKRIILVQGAMSADDRQRMEGYLAWSASIPYRLPSNHPYRDDGPYVAA